MNLKFKTHRIPRSEFEIKNLNEEFGDQREWDGSLIFDLHCYEYLGHIAPP